MQLGILLEVEEGLTWGRLRRAMQAAEELGYDALWLSDHFDSIHHPGIGGLETWTALAFVASGTRRIDFGPLVSPITFRHPALLARMAASLAELSDGRLVLGLGAGWNEAEHHAFGVPFPSVAERTGRLEETIEVIGRLLGTSSGAFAGRYYQVDALNTRPRTVPPPHVPLLVGGMGERRTLPIVARYADEWNLTTADPAVYRTKAAHLSACCDLIGRDPRTIRRSVSVGFLAGRDTAELEQRSVAMQRLVPRLATVDVQQVPEMARELGWIAGTASAIVRQLQALADAGVDRVMLNHYDQDDGAVLELLASDVLPAVAGF